MNNARNKYRNKKTVTPDGICHDSQKEAKGWMELKLMERAGEISGLQRQVKFVLIPKQKGERECSYIADFVYQGKDGNVVEDCKGVRTEAYRIKRKLMLWTHGITILET